MRHRILTCKNHPELRWSTKDIAWSEREDGTGFYNHRRHISFNGTPSGEGMYADGSGLNCATLHPVTGETVRECNCAASQLVLAPEDALVTV